jgi:hypothetical protein
LLAFGLAHGVSSLAQEKAAAEKPKRKIELAYRWDLLDGKTATYDVETVQIQQKSLRPADDEAAKEVPEQRSFVKSTAKQRLAFAFKGAERGRGRVTVTLVRVQVALTGSQTGEAETETFSYDSQNPPPGGVPAELKAIVDALMVKPYTLVVTRTGVVEAVEGRPKEHLAALQATFIDLPRDGCAEGEGWKGTSRSSAAPYGDFVTTMAFKLAHVEDAADPSAGRWTLESTTAIELDDSKSQLDKKQHPEAAEVTARLEEGGGSGKTVFDQRGLKLEEEVAAKTSFVVRAGGEHHEKRTGPRRALGGSSWRSSK